MVDLTDWKKKREEGRRRYRARFTPETLEAIDAVCEDYELYKAMFDYGDLEDFLINLPVEGPIPDPIEWIGEFARREKLSKEDLRGLIVCVLAGISAGLNEGYDRYY